jgi:hypothetical protein
MGACQPIMPEPAATTTSTPEEAAKTATDMFVPYTSAAGFELSLPEGWATADDPAGVMVVASSPDLLAAEDLLPISDGVLMLLLNMSKDELPQQPLEGLLGMFVDSRALPAEVTAGPDETTIGGQAAIRTAGAGEADGTRFFYSAAAIATDTRVGRAIAIFPETRDAELRPLVDHVLDSIIVGEPTPEPLDLSAVEGEIAPDQPVSAELQPDTTMIWRLTGSVGQSLIVAAIPTSTLDIVVGLVDAGGAPVLAVGEADSEGDGGAERRLVTLSADGDYYVVVRGFTGSGGDFEAAVITTAVAAQVESAEDLIGSWGDSTFYRFDADGTFRSAFDPATFDTEPFYLGQYQVENGQIILGRNEAGEFCADGEGVYEGVILAGGELSLSPVEDTCPRRAFGLTDIVLPPAER